MVLCTKIWVGVMGRNQNIVIFHFSAGPAGAPRQADWALDTGQAIGAHTGAGGQCADPIETDVDADGPTRILGLHTDSESGGPGRAKSGTRLPT